MEEHLCCDHCRSFISEEPTVNCSSSNALDSEAKLAREDAGNCFLCAALKQAQFWVDECLNSHHTCKSEQDSYLPTRVLDVGPPDGSCDPSLSVKRDDHPRSGVYVALSYCWGTAQPLLTTTLNMKEREQSIPVAEFPKTIRDAVFITRRLGIRYLWVDALCILQGTDDDARADWQKESAHMDEIYGNALFTLVAGASIDCDAGMFRSSFQDQRGLKPVIPPAIPLDSASIRDDPINLRAWTLQERLLSRRVLSFWSHDMAWHCKKDGFMQSRRQGDVSNRIVTYDIFSDGDAARRWMMLVQDYSRRAMTKSEDKLPALSGVARKLQNATGDTYTAGLWRRSLFYLLLWRVEFLGVMSFAPAARPCFYRAPSWSWAAVDGNIAFGGPREARKPHTEIIECYIQPVSELDALGAVKHGKLIVCGPIKEVSLSGVANKTVLTDPTEPRGNLGGAWQDPDDLGVFGEIRSPKRYCLLWASRENEAIDQQFVLLLAPIHGLREHYIRVGTGLIDDINWFTDVPKRKLTIL